MKSGRAVPSAILTENVKSSIHVPTSVALSVYRSIFAYNVKISPSFKEALSTSKSSLKVHFDVKGSSMSPMLRNTVNVLTKFSVEPLLGTPINEPVDDLSLIPQSKMRLYCASGVLLLDSQTSLESSKEQKSGPL